ncbi:M1 family peptidase [Mucilaginibacter hurinus]|uniref:Aminopeptidase N n=1 Tax=Mucilaginibacter hurinus TaxID=2201324 RepID=A0A367GMN8_9SPHI|nr:M1 family metallopeptidase [Mucilaginibacter hurinus]RCH54737.1 M1 family peptidase [Mucilaginibacter hurinus]
MKKFVTCLSFLALSLITGYAQVPGSPVDVEKYTFRISLTDQNNVIEGAATVTVNVLKDTEHVQLDLVKKDATGKGMLVTSVTEKGKPLRFEHQGDALKIFARAKANTKHSYVIKYSGIPADGLIISTNDHGERTFFGDNWLRRAHNWLPCVDDVADKAAVEFVVKAPSKYRVIANGVKNGEFKKGSYRVTAWKETVPIPTKLMVIGVARFAVKNHGTITGIPIYSYVFPQDTSAGFKSYAYAKEVLPFLINKLGPYAYKKLANVQSKTKWGGMENASAIFYYENSVDDKEIEALVAHEIAHQWFGDAATEKTYRDVWLSEGFATFLTHYYHEHKYGTDSLNQRLMADKKKIFGFEKERRTPIVDSLHAKDYTDILNANSYQKAAWVLHMLRRKLGDTVFWQGVRAYYAQYKNSNAGTADFIAVMEKSSGQNLQQFFTQWLHTPGHPVLKVTFDTTTESGKLLIKITQQQDFLYDMPLEYIVNHEKHTITIKERSSTIKVPLPVTEIGFDPDVNSLAEIVMENPDYSIKE